MMLLREILFPKFCFGCGFLGSYICFRCRRSLLISQTARCFYCGLSSFQGLTHPNCGREFGVDGFIYIYKYQGFLKKIIKAAKYKGVRECFQELLKLAYPFMFDRLIFYKKKLSPLFVEAIPLHESRMRRRGFNQSQIIADFISEYFSVQKDSSLIKEKKTGAQAELSRVQRLENLNNAFILKQTTNLQNKNILLVDDVSTTGSTLGEATKILKTNGAAQVIAFALAKG